jgi:hypothetical protein
MQNEDMVQASEFCVHHGIDLSFIHSLKEYGLIETVLVSDKIFLPVSGLSRLEKIVYLTLNLILTWRESRLLPIYSNEWKECKSKSFD